MTSSLPAFSKPNTLALHRIGPHNKLILDIIICSLLADGWIDRIPSKKRFSYRFNIDQEAFNNGDYIRYINKLFYLHGYCPSPHPKSYIRNGGKRTLRLTTFTFTSFDWIYEGFYYVKKSGDNQNIRVKRIPLWIKSYLTPLGFATWISEDGSRQINQGIYLATNCFTYKECIYLADLLNHLFSLKTSVIRTGAPNQWRISIWKQSMTQLRQVVNKYMIGNMKRKISL